MLKKISLFILITFVLLPFFGFTQERLTGLSSNPIIAKEAIQNKLNSIKSIVAPLKLPFREDFSKI